MSESLASNRVLARLAKNLAKSGDFLSRKHKMVVFSKFCSKSGGFMLLTPFPHLNYIGT
jgi:hypothetical protein